MVSKNMKLYKSFCSRSAITDSDVEDSAESSSDEEGQLPEDTGMQCVDEKYV